MARQIIVGYEPIVKEAAFECTKCDAAGMDSGDFRVQRTPEDPPTVCWQCVWDEMHGIIRDRR